ncbi:TetR/AcrR family transcriptional regulator [Sphingomonas bisphenolicum]
MQEKSQASADITTGSRRARRPPLETFLKADDNSTKTVILRSALDVFARHGFEGASMPKIAEAARVGHPLIHYHFGSKENLWREAVAHSVGGLLENAATLELSSEDIPPLDRLRSLTGAFTLFAALYPSHLAIFMFEVRARSERFTWLMDNYIEPFIAKLKGVFAEARARGEIKDIPVDNLISIFTGGIVSHFSINMQSLPNRPAEVLAAEHAAYVIDVVLDGIVIKDGVICRSMD